MVVVVVVIVVAVDAAAIRKLYVYTLFPAIHEWI